MNTTHDLQTALTQLNQGNLRAAIDACNRSISANPLTLEMRVLLAQLLCFTRNWERLRVVLDQASQRDSKSELLPMISLIERLASGESKREQVFREGRAPGFLTDPGEIGRLSLLALTHLREKNAIKRDAVLAELDELRPEFTVRVGGETSSDFRELDNNTAFVLEGITISGEYYWVPFTTIESVEISKANSLLDHVWASSVLRLRSGEEVQVFLNTISFFGTDSDESVMLGRSTCFVDDGGGIQVAAGGKVYLLDGDREITLHEAERIEFVDAGQP